MADMSALRECPFCGDDDTKGAMAMFAPQTGAKWSKVTCRVCGTSAPSTVWNQRPSIATLEAKLAEADGKWNSLYRLYQESESKLAEARKDAERLRGGLAWYASGSHYELPEWEDCSGESANWLFPPMGEVVGQPSWMVDDGSIARAVLDGAWVNPNDADAEIIAFTKIANAEQHREYLARISELMPSDPAPDTNAGKELMLLSELVEQYEKAAIDAALAQKEGKS